MVVLGHGGACWAVGTRSPRSSNGASVNPARTDTGRGVCLQRGFSFSSMCVTCLGDDEDLNTQAKSRGCIEEVYEELCKGQSQQTAKSMCCVLGVEICFSGG